ncbi:PVC-type heme-binding CxxCH protein, partial [Singulisphaera rosea]
RADSSAVVALLSHIAEGAAADPDVADDVMRSLASEIQTDQIAGPRLDSLKRGLSPLVGRILEGPEDGPLYVEAALLATSWEDPRGFAAAKRVFGSSKQTPGERVEALGALVSVKDLTVLGPVADVVTNPRENSAEFRGQLLGTLGRLDDPKVGEVVLEAYPRLDPQLQPRAVELLTQRTSWSRALLKAIDEGKLHKDALNLNQVRKLLTNKDPELAAQAKARWGTIREGRDPKRDEVIAQVRRLIGTEKGDKFAGREVFRKVCAQCHKIYGEGQDVGPEITLNGRGSYDQLLSNVFDPSLVIGAAYQATTVASADGRVLTGLLVEDNPSRIVLKTQGGKLETISRAELEELKISPLSLMPEDLEKQLSPRELIDLFAFLKLDRPPDDPKARSIPGAP